MAISMDDIKTLRTKTGAGVMDAKKALEESQGDMAKAEAWIAEKGLARAAKKADRETAEGYIGAYIHHTGKSAAMVKLLCETDFVAKTDEFQELARELAMQVASMQPESVEDFLEQDYIRDSSMTIAELVQKTTAKLGENVQIGEIIPVRI